MPSRVFALCSFSSFLFPKSQMAKRYRSKDQEFASTKTESEQVDRISSLPDDIIFHILSFLPTIEAVTTSVLSIRWRLLWTSIFTFDFEDNWPCFPETSFSFVIHNILAQRRTCIKRLRISNYNKFFNLNLINTLISIAVTQNLEEMDLFCYYFLEATLPSTLFTCKTISVMKLSLSLTINLNHISSFHLPSLKVLHLYLLYLVDDESMMRLFSGCPVLEELFYEVVKSNNSTSFKICMPSLKKLHIKCHDKIVQIVTPSIEYLQVQETKVCDSLIGNLPNLVQAHVDIYFDQHEIEYVSKFFNGIRQTKFLWLSNYTTKVLADAGFEFPEFYNLVHLKLCLSTTDSYFLTQLLLAKCPRLEILDIDKVCEESERRWTQPTKPVPSCVISHLIVFKFREYSGSKDELKLIKYILKNAKVLKTVTIQMANWLKPKKASRDMSKLHALLSASKYCHLTNYQILSGLGPLNIQFKSHFTYSSFFTEGVTSLSTYLADDESLMRLEYGGSQHELELTKYIRNNAKVLKTVTIHMAKWLKTIQTVGDNRKDHCVVAI
ncbi:putative FBD-associated F-box protein, partial [Mucuna pruriens]